MSVYHNILIRNLVLQTMVLACLLLQSQAATAMEQNGSGTNPEIIRAETLSGLQTFFQALDYDWQQLDQGVPPFILERFPQDINQATSVIAKKQAFFMGLLPMILMVNQEIEDQRKAFTQILERSHKARETSDEDLERLEKTTQAYRLRGDPITDHRTRERLLKRIDIIPPSMVLAQAANESAWGTSRFAQLGNNLFGEWTYKPGTGIIPAGRPPGETYEVRKFSSIYAAIHSYMRNLNTNGAYRKLRDIRAKLRQEEKPVTGIALARGLSKYSQRGDEYIKEIQSMIRQNKLAVANETFLREPGVDVLISINTTGSGLISSRNRAIGHFSPSPRENP